MQIVRIVLVLAAIAAAGGQFLQEHYRLSALDKLAGREARDRYEARRGRSERGLFVVAAVALVGGVLAVVDIVLRR